MIFIKKAQCGSENNWGSELSASSTIQMTKEKV